MCEPVITLMHLLNARFGTDLVFVAVVVKEESVTVHGKLYPRVAVSESAVFKELIQGRTIQFQSWPEQEQLEDCTMMLCSSAHFKLNVEAPYCIVFMFPGQVDPVLTLPVGL